MSLRLPDAQQGEPIRVVVADDHTIFRESLSALLGLTSVIEVVGQAADGEEAIDLTRRLHPDVLLLDLAMPHKDGMEVLRELSRSDVRIRVIVLSAALGRAETLQALQLGARGVVLKAASTDSLVQGIRKVVEGEYWVGKEGVASLIDAITTRREASPLAKAKYGLTPRENEIIVAVLEGYSNPEIAERFTLSEQTVKHHLSHIFDKLGVYSRLELALFAVNHHLVEAAS